MHPKFTLPTVVDIRWHSLALVLLLFVSISGMLLVHGAPVPDPDAPHTLEAPSAAESEFLLDNIMSSGLKNECENSQDRRDTCERCSRLLFDQRTGYEGCCRNYDDIYLFCEKFLDYSFDSPISKVDQISRDESLRK